MKLLTCIEEANRLRPNALEDAEKAKWIELLEAQFAETMEEDIPCPTFPADKDLLMPTPYDRAYIYYLAAEIDLANEDSDLYEADSEMANTLIAEAKAWWRRRHKPTKNTKVKVW